MHKLKVKHFGPLQDCELVLNDFVILIGPQASGKSTISKLFFFFLHVRDEYVKFLLGSVDSSVHDPVAAFGKLIKERFIRFWGPVASGSPLSIQFTYQPDVFIDIGMDKSQKYIDIHFSPAIVSHLRNDWTQLKAGQAGKPDLASLFNAADRIASQFGEKNTIENLLKNARHLFAFEDELLFIPAGRSLVSILLDQLPSIDERLIDFPMMNFIQEINGRKSFFSRPLENIVKELQVQDAGNPRLGLLRKMATIIRRIMKGDYVQDSQGGRLYLEKSKFVKIGFASSGQQESIWILLSLFLLGMGGAKTLVFIEEPEAHLFPVAQKDMVELIAHLRQQIQTRFFITTHSPYILSALNNHIYAGELGQRCPDAVDKVIPKEAWVRFAQVAGFYVKDGALDDLCDADLNMLKVEMVDQASGLVNDEYDQLFNIEQGDADGAH